MEKIKLTETQKAYLDGYHKGFNHKLNLPEEGTVSAHCDENTPERVKGYLEGQAATFNLLEQDLGLVDIGSQIDATHELSKSKYYEGYQHGILDVKRSILYEIIKATENNPQLKTVQAPLITEILKIIQPDETYDIEPY
jgi:hypothetical protein